MLEIQPGLAGRHETTPDPGQTAAAIGNVGVEVVGTPFLVGYLEAAAHRAILPYCEPGEVTVGTRIEVDHLAAALPGRTVGAATRVVAADGRHVTFEVEVRQGEHLLMKGRHGRAIVRLDRLLAVRQRQRQVSEEIDERANGGEAYVGGRHLEYLDGNTLGDAQRQPVTGQQRQHAHRHDVGGRRLDRHP